MENEAHIQLWYSFDDQCVVNSTSEAPDIWTEARRYELVRRLNAKFSEQRIHASSTRLKFLQMSFRIFDVSVTEKAKPPEQCCIDLLTEKWHSLGDIGANSHKSYETGWHFKWRLVRTSEVDAKKPANIRTNEVVSSDTKTQRVHARSVPQSEQQSNQTATVGFSSETGQAGKIRNLTSEPLKEESITSTAVLDLQPTHEQRGQGDIADKLRQELATRTKELVATQRIVAKQSETITELRKQLSVEVARDRTAPVQSRPIIEGSTTRESIFEAESELTRAEAEKLLSDRCKAIRLKGGFRNWLKVITQIQPIGIEANQIVVAFDVLSELALRDCDVSVKMANTLLTSLEGKNVLAEFGRALIEALRRFQVNSQTQLQTDALGPVSISPRHAKDTRFAVFAVRQSGIPRETRVDTCTTKLLGYRFHAKT